MGVGRGGPPVLVLRRRHDAMVLVSWHGICVVDACDYKAALNRAMPSPAAWVG